ncbi:MAG: DUF6122 family protein [Ginsengibacter sp.]
MQFLIHYFLHFIFPVILAWVFYKDKWIKVSIIFLLTMLVDLDHLLANPIYSPCRCSIAFHPLHSYIAIVIYLILLLPVKTRIISIGLLMHMMTDALDCFLSRHCM